MDTTDSNQRLHRSQTANDRSTREIPPPPRKSRLLDAFRLRTAQYPWRKAVSASITMALCLLVGWVFGHTNWGMLAVMGTFTSLYVHNEPYFVRAKKLAIVAIGLAISFAIGSLSAGSIGWMAVSLGLVSAVATYICGAWKVPTPSAYFFILASAVGTGLPVDHSAVLMRTGLALLGGGIAWCISMSGWIVNAHGPETTAVKNAYRALGTFLASIVDVSQDTARHQATIALRTAEDHVRAGELRWRSTRDAHRLYRLVQKANQVFLTGIALSAEKVPLDPMLVGSVRAITDTITDPDRAASLVVPNPTHATPTHERLVTILTEIVDILVTDSVPSSMSVQEESAHSLNTRHAKRLSMVFKSVLTKHSLVLPSTLRIGIAVMLATWIAAALGNNRPYWVPLTVASVLQGATVVATVHRTLQRAIGTSIGVILGVAILTLQPVFGFIILIITVLQLIIELIIVRNYAIAVIFITPIPLLLAEMGGSGLTPSALIEARLVDTWLGCLLGMIAAMTLWHRSSSVRIRTVLKDTIELEGEFLVTITQPSNNQQQVSNLDEKRKQLQISLINLHMIQESALHEFPRNTDSETLWPAVIATARIGYSLLSMSEYIPGTYLTDNERDEIMQVFQTLSESVVKDKTEVSCPKALSQFPDIQEECQALQESLIPVHNTK